MNNRDKSDLALGVGLHLQQEGEDMIILEGPDGGGKTVLVRRLAEDLAMPISQRVVDENTVPLTNLTIWVERNLHQGLVRTLFDRHRLISEPIYGPVMRGSMQEPGFNNIAWLKRMQRRFRALDPFLIFCLPPASVVFNNVCGEERNEKIEPHIETIYWLYVNAAASFPKSWVWDYTQHHSGPRGFTPYNLLLRDIRDWLWEKGLYQ